MSFEDYKKVIEEKYAAKDSSQMTARHKNFCLTNRSRGAKAMKILCDLEDVTSFNGERLLDIGCGHGGMTIEAAKLGMSAHGIDILSENIELAKINAQNDCNAVFLSGDFSFPGYSKHFEGETFDYIAVYDVVEHIYDIYTFLCNLRDVSTDNALIITTVPNQYGFNNIITEPHFGSPFATIIPKSFWPTLGYVSETTFHRSLGLYQALFASLEMPIEAVVCENYFSTKALQQYATPKLEKMKTIVSNIDKSKQEVVTPYLEWFFNQYQEDMEKNAVDPDYLYLKYFIDTICFYSRKTQKAETTIIKDFYQTSKTNKPFVLVESINYEQSANHLECEISVGEKLGENYTFAWYVFKVEKNSTKRIDIIWYTDSPSLSYTFKESGNYRIQFFIKQGEQLMYNFLPEDIHVP